MLSKANTSNIASQSSKSEGENVIAGGNRGTGVVGSVGATCGNSARGSGRTGSSRATGGDNDVLIESRGRMGELGECGREGGRGPDGLCRRERRLCLRDNMSHVEIGVSSLYDDALDEDEEVILD